MGLVLPDGVDVLGISTVRITATIEATQATRTFSAGIVLSGAQADRTYALSTDQVLVTLGGTAAALANLQGDSLVVTADVDGLGAGPHTIALKTTLPAGITLIAVNPPKVTVTITVPEPPSPSPSPSPSVPPGSPGALTMPRLFGTDGIRGVANVDLKPTIAYALGRATAHRLIGAGGALVVGQDTRRSCDMFVAAISAGATSMGVDVHQVGVVPTPALAFLAGQGDFAAGIMVSASHNPADDNGLKVLDQRGLKLDDDIEDELEALIWRSEELGGVGNAGLGRIHDASGLLERYRASRLALARGDLDRRSGSSSTAPTARVASSARRSSPRRAPGWRSSTTTRTA